MILRLTIPPPAEQMWNRRFAVISPIGATLFLFLLYDGIFCYKLWKNIGWNIWVFYEKIPLIIIVLIFSGFLGFYIKCKTQTTRAPNSFYLFTFGALIMSFHWIWACSEFLVNYLDVLGFSFRIPAIYLGITFLSIGNSLVDLIACTSITKRGFPIMALTSVFSSPIFNMLVGLGASFIALLAKNHSKSIDLTQYKYLCILPLIALITQSFICIELVLLSGYNKFIMGKWLAKGIFIGYFAFFIIATLITFT